MISNNQFTALGVAHHRYQNIPFGIRQRDRLMHMYIIGQTGVGKSVLLSNLAFQDAQAGIGFCLIDPHGTLASELSANLNVKHIYWNVADPNSPYGYNPLTHVSAKYRPLVVSGLIETLKKQFADSWGNRMEHLLRYSLYALLEQPRADLRDIVPLLLLKDFQRQILYRVTDPQVLQFWQKEYPAMNYKGAFDGVAPIANKLGGFLAHPIVRKAVCDPEQPLRFRQLMDDGECLIVNLAKGQLGADIANMVGGLIVSSVTNAAFTRHDLPEASRVLFTLIVDEYSNLTSTVFATILSEIRKYGLSVVLANQFVDQAEQEVFAAIMGNVGSIIAFRLGALDAPLFVQQLETVSTHDLVNLPNYQAFMQLMVDGMKSATFTAKTYPAFNLATH